MRFARYRAVAHSGVQMLVSLRGRFALHPLHDAPTFLRHTRTAVSSCPLGQQLLGTVCVPNCTAGASPSCGESLAAAAPVKRHSCRCYHAWWAVL